MKCFDVSNSYVVFILCDCYTVWDLFPDYIFTPHRINADINTILNQCQQRWQIFILLYTIITMTRNIVDLYTKYREKKKEKKNHDNKLNVMTQVNYKSVRIILIFH